MLVQPPKFKPCPSHWSHFLLFFWNNVVLNFSLFCLLRSSCLSCVCVFVIYWSCTNKRWPHFVYDTASPRGVVTVCDSHQVKTVESQGHIKLDFEIQVFFFFKWNEKHKTYKEVKHQQIFDCSRSSFEMLKVRVIKWTINRNFIELQEKHISYLQKPESTFNFSWKIHYVRQIINSCRISRPYAHSWYKLLL